MSSNASSPLPPKLPSPTTTVLLSVTGGNAVVAERACPDDVAVGVERDVERTRENTVKERQYHKLQERGGPG